MSIKSPWMKNGITAALLALSITPVYAVTGACSATGSFNVNIASDWTQAQNVTGTSLELPTPLSGMLIKSIAAVARVAKWRCTIRSPARYLKTVNSAAFTS
ncbi:hypothetical protein [Citrobacter portucalensis]|uniref:hypothetical protein n=1 Tax=Citrobacter portucalensis TaxID=1639133 RepID=UPI002180C20E|nr:hypothetical protein [Citrobacter portucalensis]